MSNIPHWLRLTIRAALLEARYLNRLISRTGKQHSVQYLRGGWRRVAKRDLHIETKAKRLRKQAAVAAYHAGFIGEDWRRIYKPIAFHNPVYTSTHAKYPPVNLDMLLSDDWRIEFDRLQSIGPVQPDNDPRPLSWRKLTAA